VTYRNLTKTYFRLVKAEFAAQLQRQRWRPEQLDQNEQQAILRQKPELEFTRDLPATPDYKQRVEAFPAPSEVLGAGFFYKTLHEPIEQVIQGGAPPVLIPRNSDRGRNLGMELEARSGLGRVWRRLSRLSINANASIISSIVRLHPLITQTGSMEHPLQGQASYLVNAALSYVSEGHRTEMSVLVSAVGKRLDALGLNPLPDVYEQPATSLDATLTFMATGNLRFKLAAKNLIDPRIQRLQGSKEVSGFRTGRTYSIAVSSGS